VQYADYTYPEIEWSILDSTGSTVFADPENDYSTAVYQEVNTIVSGLCWDVQYSFRITSTVDGFCCGNYGYYMVKSGGVMVLANFAYTGWSEKTNHFALTTGAPSTSPTVGPTVSPAPTIEPCDEEIVVTIQYADLFYPEIEWSILDPYNSVVVFVGPENNYDTAAYQEVNTNVSGLCRGVEYSFRITSTLGIGLCCGEYSYYKVESGGALLLANYNAFTGSEYTQYFTLT